MKRRWTIQALMGAALLCIIGPCWGTSGTDSRLPGPPPDTTMPTASALSIPEVVRMALQDNLDLQIVSTDASIAQYRVMGERGAFDHFLSGQLMSSMGGQANLVANQELPLVNGPSGVVAMRQHMENGSTWTLSYQGLGQSYGIPGNQQGGNIIQIQPAGSFTNAGTVIMSVNYPLMRGAGRMVNTARLRIAQNNEKIATLLYTQRAEDLAADVARTAWNVVGARKLYAIEEAGLDQSRRYLSLLDERIKVGASAPYERYFAMQSVAMAEAIEIRARRDAASSTTNLRRLVHTLPLRLEIVAESHLEDGPHPVVQTVSLEADATDPDPRLQQALEQRPELQRLNQALNNADIEEALAGNGMLPQLDVVVNTGTSLQGGMLYQVGIQFEQSFEHRTARANLEISRLQKQQAKLALQKMQQQIAAEVSEACLAADGAASAADAARRSREAAEQQVVAERKRFTAGLTPAIGVFQVQQRLLEAQRVEVLATIDYETALIERDRACGGSLQKYHLALVPLETSSNP